MLNVHRYLRNITLPGALITKSSGDVLKGLLTSGLQQEDVYVSMDWNDILPNAERYASLEATLHAGYSAVRPVTRPLPATACLRGIVLQCRRLTISHISVQ